MRIPDAEADEAFFSLPQQEQARRIRQRENALIAAFRDAVQGSDAERCWRAVQALQFQGLWRRAVRSIMGMNPSDVFRRHCLESWVIWGDSLRNEIGEDLFLIELLGVLMPKYEGGAILLYRGDSFFNRCRRTYGLSWTSSRKVARSFADGIFCRTSKGGSCLLETYAPHDAVICAPGLLNNDYGKDEFIVDRRRLKRVDILERFPEETFEEHRRRVEAVAKL